MNSGTSQDLQDIMGLTRNDIYAVGSAGTIIHYYRSAPMISYFIPDRAVAGDSIVITGSYFTGTTAVSIGGIAVENYAVDSDTQITAIVPQCDSGTISITTPLGTSTIAGFTFVFYDLNGDRKCNVLDLILIGASFGNTSGPEDINRDGIVNVLDLIGIGNHIGETW
jgi:hypothetical protein